MGWDAHHRISKGVVDSLSVATDAARPGPAPNNRTGISCTGGRPKILFFWHTLPPAAGLWGPHYNCWWCCDCPLGPRCAAGPILIISFSWPVMRHDASSSNNPAKLGHMYHKKKGVAERNSLTSFLFLLTHTHAHTRRVAWLQEKKDDTFIPCRPVFFSSPWREFHWAGPVVVVDKGEKRGAADEGQTIYEPTKKWNSNQTVWFPYFGFFFRGVDGCCWPCVEPETSKRIPSLSVFLSRVCTRFGKPRAWSGTGSLVYA